MNKLMTTEEAVALVEDGMTFSFSGFVACAIPEELLIALENRFLETGSPNNLFLYYTGAPGLGEERGGNHLAHPGMIRKMMGGHTGLTKRLAALINENLFPAYLIPQGVNVHMMRAVAGGKPGVITKVGLKTYCDPRLEGCKANEAAKEDVVELIKLDGKEYLFYKAVKIDVAYIKGSTADEDGNISLEKEGLFDAQFEMAAATHNSGGKVIALVERLAKRGSLNPKDIKIPGILVDGIVVGNPETCKQSFAQDEYNPCWAGEIKTPEKEEKFEKIILNERLICARRAAMEIYQNSFINFGLGIPQDISTVLKQEGQAEYVMSSVESGVIGGSPSGGLGMGTAENPVAIIKHPEMFDLYDGGSLKTTFLGAAEIDSKGNVNVTKFNGRMVGPGGFINISQNTPNICYCGTFTAGGFECKVEDGKLIILKEGEVKKFKNTVEQVSFSGSYALETGQKVLFITERAVFQLMKEGITLIEVAPGINLEKDILEQMEFKPVLSKDLKTMDERIFRNELMGLVLK